MTLRRFQTTLEDGRVRCDVCPRLCALRDGQRGLCFVRARAGDQIVCATYGRSSGFCLDPVEKKPLNHFLPGTSVLSFGTAGCNLACKFCQNWDISKSRQMDTLQAEASPEAIAEAAERHGARSVAFTYNDPVVFLEYAVDTAKACRARNVETVAVTAGYVNPAARRELFSVMSAANVDLKAFSESFYRDVTAGQLAPVLDTLRYLVHETDVWTEITTLLIPDLNDSPGELARMFDWILETLGPDVPLHFSAFHPDFKMLDRGRTPQSTLQRARHAAMKAGLRYVYTGNVHDPEGDATYCPNCRNAVIERDWYALLSYDIVDGACARCGHPLAGRFEASPGEWGRKRLRIRP